MELFKIMMKLFKNLCLRNETSLNWLLKETKLLFNQMEWTVS